MPEECRQGNIARIKPSSVLPDIRNMARKGNSGMLIPEDVLPPYLVPWPLQGITLRFESERINSHS